MIFKQAYVITKTTTHLVESLELDGREPGAFLDAGVSLEEGSGGHAPRHPLNGDHVTRLAHQGSVTVLTDKVGLDAWKGDEQI